MFRSLFGYDYFISYARSDASVYARELARLLHEDKFEVFLDLDEAAAGTSLKSTLQSAVSRSSVLILIATERAFESRWVRDEVNSYLTKRDLVIVVSAGGTAALIAAGMPFEGLVDHIHITEDATSLQNGTPRPDVVRSVKSSRKIIRRRRSRAVAVVATMLFLLGATAFSTWANSRARTSKSDAELELYVSVISGTYEALQAGEPATAASRLHLAPEHLRGWEYDHLAARVGNRLLILEYGGIGLSCVAVGEHTAVTGGSDGRVEIERLGAGDPIVVDFKSQPVLGVALEEDAGLLAVALLPGKVAVVELATGTVRAEFSFLDDPRTLERLGEEKMLERFEQIMSRNADAVQFWRASVSFEEHGSAIIASFPALATAVWKWEPDTVELLADKRNSPLVRAHGGRRFVTSPIGAGIVDSSGRVRLETPPEIVASHGSDATALLCSTLDATGTNLACGYSDGMVRTWRISDDSLDPILEFAAFDAACDHVALVRSGTLVAASRDRLVAFVLDGSRRPRGIPIEAHSNWIDHIATSERGDLVATTTIDGRTRVFQLSTDDANTSLTELMFGRDVGPVAIHTSVAFDDDRGSLLTATDHERGRVLEMDLTQNLVKTVLARSVRTVNSVSAMSTGLGWMVLGGVRGGVRVVDLGSERVEQHSGYGARVVAVAIQPDRKLVLFGGEDCNARLWSLEGERATRTLYDPHEATVSAVAFLSGGDQILTACVNGRICVRDTDTLRIRYQWGPREVGPLGGVNALAVDDERGRFACGWTDGSVTMHSQSGGELLAHLHEHRRPVDGLAFHPDGTRLASGSHDRRVLLWSLEHQRVLLAFHHPRPVTDLAFSGDGRTLASGCIDGQVRVWRSSVAQDPASGVARPPR